MKAVAYLRVSTLEQATDGYSIQAQRRAADGYCQAHGWELVEVYADEGRSGSSIEGRDELKRLLADSGSGHFERVIFWKLDRLGRSLRDLLRICDDLEAAGVGIVSIQESIDTGTAAGRMMRSILGALGEFEREVIVSRIKAGIEEKARQGELVGPLPLGYTRDEAGNVVVDEVLGPLVKAAFERYATGRHSLRQMIAWAASVGLRSREGNALDRLSIRKLLTNISYSGKVAYHRRQGGGVVADGKHPAIVDAATYERVQTTLRSRRRHAGSTKPFGREPYPLSGVALCGVDAAPLLGLRASKKRHRYMRCSTAQRQGKDACSQPMVRADLLEAQFAAYVGTMRLPPEYLGEVVAELRQRDQPSSDTEEFERIERQQQRWQRLFVLGEIDEQRYKAEVSTLRRRLAKMERPEEILDIEEAVRLLQDLGALWHGSPRPTQREFVHEVFEQMQVIGPQLAAITPKAAYAPLFVLDRRVRFGGEGGLVWLPGQDSNLQPSG